MIHVPFVGDGLRPETRAWAVEHRAPLHEVGYADTAYWRELCRWWAFEQTPLIIVEQDMIPGTNVVENMQECPAPWCSSPYPVFAGMAICMTGLGCVKFSVELMEKHPGMAEAAGYPFAESDPIGGWQHLDTRLTQRLLMHGYRPHAHAMSTHLHEYSEEQLERVRSAMQRIQERERLING